MFLEIKTCIMILWESIIINTCDSSKIQNNISKKRELTINSQILIRNNLKSLDN